MRLARALCVLLIAGCGATVSKAEHPVLYRLGCGFDLAPYADSRQWPECLP